MAITKQKNSSPEASPESLSSQERTAVFLEMDRRALEVAPITSQEFSDEVSSHLESKKNEKPGLFRRVQKILDHQIQSVTDDWANGREKNAVLRSMILAGGAAGIGWLTFEAVNSVRSWFKKNTDPEIQEKGVLGRLRDWIEGKIMGDTVDKIRNTLLITALGTLGIAIPAAAISSIVKKVSIAETQAAWAQGGAIGVLKLIWQKIQNREIDLPPDVVAAFQSKIDAGKDKIAKIGLGSEGEEAIRKWLDHPSFPGLLDTAKAQLIEPLQKVGMPASILDRIRKEDIAETLRDNPALWTAGGGGILMILGMTLLRPKTIAVLGLKGGIYGGGTLLGIYVALKILGVNVPIADDLFPPEVREALQIVNGQEYVDELAALMTSPEVVQGVQKLLAYFKRNLERLKKEPWAVKLIKKYDEKYERIKNLDFMDTLLLFKEHKLKNEEVTKALADLAHGAIGIAAIVGIISLLNKSGRGPETAIAGFTLFLGYCAYNEWKDLGERRPKDLLSVNCAEFMVFQAVEELDGWRVGFYRDLKQNLRSNKKTAGLVEEVEALFTEEGLQVASPEWFLRLHEILKKADVTAFIGEGVLALLWSGGKIAIRTDQGILDSFAAFAGTGVKEGSLGEAIQAGVIEYGGVAAPFITIGAICHPQYGPVIGGIIGFTAPFFIFYKSVRWSIKGVQVVSHTFDHAHYLREVFSDFQDRRLLAIMKLTPGSERFGYKVIRDTNRAKRILELYVTRYEALRRHGILTEGTSRRLSRIYEDMVDYWEHKGVLEGEGVPQTIKEALQERGVANIGRWDHRTLFRDQDDAKIMEERRARLSEKLELAKNKIERQKIKSQIQAIDDYLSSGTHISLRQPENIPDLTKLSREQIEILRNQMASRLEAVPPEAANEFLERLRYIEKHLELLDITKLPPKEGLAAFEGACSRLQKEWNLSDILISDQMERVTEIMKSEKRGLDDPLIRGMIAKIVEDAKKMVKARAEHIHILRKIRKSIPRKDLTLEVRRAYSLALKGPKSEIFGTVLREVRGRLILGVAINVSLFTINTITSDDPEAHMQQVFHEIFSGEMGKPMLQLLVDLLPITGTLSLGYSAITGKESVTGEETNRWACLGWGVVSLIGDIATVMSVGGATPAAMGARLLKLANEGSRAAKLLLRLWPKIILIIEKVGLQRFGERAIAFLNDSEKMKNTASTLRKVEIAGAVGMGVATFAPLFFSNHDLGTTSAEEQQDLEESGVLSRPSPESMSHSSQISERLAALNTETRLAA